ncbi:MAG: hypothetical protein ACT4OU_12990 [Hyphomicrobium sp.]
MKTYLLHHTPKSAGQDTWAVSFSVPYIAASYARAGDGVWYVKTWLTADQIQARLAILFDSRDELRVHELGRKEASLNARLPWLPGRLEDDELEETLCAPRLMWDVLQSAMQVVTGATRIPPAAIVAATQGSSRAA